LEETGKYLSRFCLEEVRLLPYHALARSKYAALQLTDTMPEAAAPTPAELNAAVEVLKQYGLPAISAFEA
jgi:pyruvate-formate lyase-activating enzyme